MSEKATVMNNLANREAIIHIDAMTLHEKYSQGFHMDDVPESERNETAQRTADGIRAILKNEHTMAPGKTCAWAS